MKRKKRIASSTPELPKQETGTLAETFKRCRNRAVPLIAIETADPAATVRQCIAALNGKAEESPVALWDICNGIVPRNDAATKWTTGDELNSMNTGNPVEALQKLYTNTPAKSVIFFSNAHRVIDQLPVAQGVWNLRDPFASSQSMLVLLAPSLVLPPELARDVVVISEPLPNRTQLAATLEDTYGDAQKTNPSLPNIAADDREDHVDTLTGLSTFEAKQVVALSLTKAGIDGKALWSRKVKQIEQCKGLCVYDGKETLADIGGLSNAKRILSATAAGKLDVSCIVFLDEIDKSFPQQGGFTSETSADQNKSLLSYIQDHKRPGVLFLGPPGTGKTILAKAIGNEHGLPVIVFDLGAVKGSGLVGQAEGEIRNALKVIHSVSDGRALFIGACNRSDSLPPELRRRFNFASIFFDLPDADERAAALKVWTAKHGLEDDQCDWTPGDGWTGAEIENACLKAWAMDCPLSESAKTIVPIAISARETVDKLRQASSGKYISANAPGIYNWTPNKPTNAQETARAITL